MSQRRGQKATNRTECLVRPGQSKCAWSTLDFGKSGDQNSRAESARDKTRHTYSNSLRVSQYLDLRLVRMEFLGHVKLVNNHCRFLWSITRSDDGKQNVNPRFRPTLRQFSPLRTQTLPLDQLDMPNHQRSSP